MPTPATPSGQTPAGDDRNLVPVDENYVAPTFEDRLRLFWQRNSKAITIVLVAVLLGIVGKGAWETVAAQKENQIGREYAAATSSTQLKAFAAAHPKHQLAGAAELRLADEAYGDGKYTDAATAYEQAVANLPSGPLASRARLGLAMSKLQGGRTAEGEAALKAFASDTKATKAFRAEAAYHLVTHAIAAGKQDDVKTYSEQLTQIDPMSPWSQRVMAMRAAIAGPASDTPPAAEPAIKLPGATK